MDLDDRIAIALNLLLLWAWNIWLVRRVEKLERKQGSTRE